MRRSLEQDPSVKFKLETEKKGSQGLNQLKTEEYDLTFLDYKLPDMNGMEVLKEARKEKISTPVIIVTSQGDEQLAVNALKNGAQDYISKNNLTADKIWDSIEYALEYSSKKDGKWEEAEETEIPDKKEIKESSFFKGDLVIRRSGRERKMIESASIRINDKIRFSNDEELTINFDDIGNIRLSQWSPNKEEKAISITEKNKSRVFLINLLSRNKIKTFFYKVLKQMIGTKATFGRHHLKGSSKGRWEIGEIEILKDSVLLSLQSRKVLIDIESVEKIGTKKVKRKRRRAYLLGIKHRVSGKKAYTTIGFYKKRKAELLYPYLRIDKDLKN